MLINVAKFVATTAHAGQTRKFSGLPYITHPAGVVAFLEKFNVGENILAAAWCHDVIEDTSITYESLELVIGTQVTDIVQELTNYKFPEGTSRVTEYWANVMRLVQASHQAQTGKCGDVYDNCKDVYAQDPVYGARFIAEKFFLVRLLYLAQGDVRQAVLNLLADVYRSMTPEHRQFCLAYIGYLNEDVPASYLDLYRAAKVAAGSGTSRFVGAEDFFHGTTAIQNP